MPIGKGERKKQKKTEAHVFVQSTWPDSEGCRKSVSLGKLLARQDSDCTYAVKQVSQSILFKPWGWMEGMGRGDSGERNLT